MRSLLSFFGVVVAGILLMGFGCERHDPRPQWDEFSKERSNAHDSAKNPKLTAKGKLPKGYASLNPNAVVEEEDAGAIIPMWHRCVDAGRNPWPQPRAATVRLRVTVHDSTDGHVVLPVLITLEKVDRLAIVGV